MLCASYVSSYVFVCRVYVFVRSHGSFYLREGLLYPDRLREPRLSLVRCVRAVRLPELELAVTRVSVWIFEYAAIMRLTRT